MKNTILTKPMIFQTSYEGVSVKGMHIFTKCDVRSEKAQKLAASCEGMAIRRMKYSLKRDREVIPHQLRLQELNIELGEKSLNPRNDIKALTIEQVSVLGKIAAISGKSMDFLRGLWEEYRYYVDRLGREFKTSEKVVYNIYTNIILR